MSNSMPTILVCLWFMYVGSFSGGLAKPRTPASETRCCIDGSALAVQCKAQLIEELLPGEPSTTLQPQNGIRVQVVVILTFLDPVLRLITPDMPYLLSSVHSTSASWRPFGLYDLRLQGASTRRNRALFGNCNVFIVFCLQACCVGSLQTESVSQCVASSKNNH